MSTSKSSVISSAGKRDRQASVAEVSSSPIAVTDGAPLKIWMVSFADNSQKKLDLSAPMAFFSLKAACQYVAKKVRLATHELEMDSEDRDEGYQGEYEDSMSTIDECVDREDWDGLQDTIGDLRSSEKAFNWCFALSELDLKSRATKILISEMRDSDYDERV